MFETAATNPKSHVDMARLTVPRATIPPRCRRFLATKLSSWATPKVGQPKIKDYAPRAFKHNSALLWRGRGRQSPPPSVEAKRPEHRPAEPLQAFVIAAQLLAIAGDLETTHAGERRAKRLAHFGLRSRRSTARRPFAPSRRRRRGRGASKRTRMARLKELRCLQTLRGAMAGAAPMSPTAIHSFIWMIAMEAQKIHSIG